MGDEVETSRLTASGWNLGRRPRVGVTVNRNPVPAPEIPPDLAWLSPCEAGRSLADFRGRFVLLDFWTRSCVNCAHVSAELDQFIARFGEQIQVVGVHSPKFPAERSLDVVRSGAAQLGITHPVVNDPDLRLWRLYGLQAWPTVALIDPEGNLVSMAVGEGEVALLGARLDLLLTPGPPGGSLSSVAVLSGRRRPSDGGLPATPHVGPLSAVDGRRRVSGDPSPSEKLVHPSRLLAWPGGGWLVSEQRGDVVLLDESFTVTDRFGGFVDPRGMALLPDGRIAVADAGRHQVLALDPSQDLLQVLAGSGRRGNRRTRRGTAALEADLASPHDVARWGDHLVIAVAGQHQILALPLSSITSPSLASPTAEAELEVVAGSSAEGLRDGAGRRARLAMPTALLADGDRLWFVDADSSALRCVDDGVEATGVVVTTVIGQSVEDSGHDDGPAAEALLQHPAGLGIDDEDRVLVADVFNGAIRRFDPMTGLVETVADGLQEPTAVVAVGGELVVVEQAANRVVRIKPEPTSHRQVADGATPARFQIPPTMVREQLRLDFVGDGDVAFELDARPADLVRTVTTGPTGMHLALNADIGQGTLSVVAHRSNCDELCTIDRLSWTIPVVVGATGADSIPLVGR